MRITLISSEVCTLVISARNCCRFSLAVSSFVNLFRALFVLGIFLKSTPMGVLAMFVYGGVRMEGKIQTQKYGFPEIFAPKNIGILHVSYLKTWVKIVFQS